MSFLLFHEHYIRNAMLFHFFLVKPRGGIENGARG